MWVSVNSFVFFPVAHPAGARSRSLHLQEAAVDGACMQLSRLFRNTRIAPHLAVLEHMQPSHAGTADVATVIGSPVMFNRGLLLCSSRPHAIAGALEAAPEPFSGRLFSQHQHVCTSCATLCNSASRPRKCCSADAAQAHCGRADFVLLLSSKVGCFWSRFHGPQSSFPEPTSHSLAVDLCTSCSGALRSFSVPRTALGVHRGTLGQGCYHASAFLY
jgi:hypothetical protein